MGRNNNNVRRSIATSLVVRTECVLLDMEENIKRFGIDPHTGQGLLGQLVEEDKPFRDRAMKRFHEQSGLYIPVNEGNLSAAGQRLGRYIYHLSYYGDLERI